MRGCDGGGSCALEVRLQFARNTATHSARDAFAAILTAGRSKEHGDVRVIGAFYRKQANSLISELTENDIAINSNVNRNAYVGLCGPLRIYFHEGGFTGQRPDLEQLDSTLIFKF